MYIGSYRATCGQKRSLVNINKVYLTSGVRFRSRIPRPDPFYIPVATLLLNFYYIAFASKFAVRSAKFTKICFNSITIDLKITV